MKQYLAVLGRQPRISLAELEALFGAVRLISPDLAEFSVSQPPNIQRLGGTLKIAEPISVPLPKFLQNLPPDGKITLGLSDFSPRATARGAEREALRLKTLLKKQGRSVRVVPNQAATLSSATSFHNHLIRPHSLEIIKFNKRYYKVLQVQNIDQYALRDQARPARDAKVGMLPPKLAQILINLCGNLPENSRLLDPFCGTGVVLQEAALIGYIPYGTDLNERMIDYSQHNLDWLEQQIQAKTKRNVVKFTTLQKPNVVKITTPQNNIVTEEKSPNVVKNTTPQNRNVVKFTTILANLERAQVAVGDAQTFQWQPPIDAVACEGYLGPPLSNPPAEIKLRAIKHECGGIILKFLQNLSSQIASGTPVVIAVPAWLRPDGHYETLNLLDEIKNLRYNVSKFSNLGQSDLIYHRAGQVVAREIIVLRKI